MDPHREGFSDRPVTNPRPLEDYAQSDSLDGSFR